MYFSGTIHMSNDLQMSELGLRLPLEITVKSFTGLRVSFSDEGRGFPLETEDCQIP